MARISEELRNEITVIFYELYKKDYGHPYNGPTLNSTKENYYYVETIFQKLIPGSKISTSALVKIFHSKKLNYHVTNFNKLNEIYIKGKIELTEGIIPEYYEWFKSTGNPFVEEHKFLSTEKLGEYLKNLNYYIAHPNDKNTGFLMINCVKHGSLVMFILTQNVKDHREVIDYLWSMVNCSWTRVRWRAAFILSKLNKELFVKSLEDFMIRSDCNLNLELISHIKSDTVEEFLRKIATESNDLGAKQLAFGVLSEIQRGRIFAINKGIPI